MPSPPSNALPCKRVAFKVYFFTKKYQICKTAKLVFQLVVVNNKLMILCGGGGFLKLINEHIL